MNTHLFQIAVPQRSMRIRWGLCLRQCWTSAWCRSIIELHNILENLTWDIPWCQTWGHKWCKERGLRNTFFAFMMNVVSCLLNSLLCSALRHFSLISNCTVHLYTFEGEYNNTIARLCLLTGGNWPQHSMRGTPTIYGLPCSSDSCYFAELCVGNGCCYPKFQLCILRQVNLQCSWFPSTFYIWRFRVHFLVNFKHVLNISSDKIKREIQRSWHLANIADLSDLPKLMGLVGPCSKANVSHAGNHEMCASPKKCRTPNMISHLSQGGWVCAWWIQTVYSYVTCCRRNVLLCPSQWTSIYVISQNTSKMDAAVFWGAFPMMSKYLGCLFLN